jgi:hypothetical protein
MGIQGLTGYIDNIQDLNMVVKEDVWNTPNTIKKYHILYFDFGSIIYTLANLINMIVNYVHTINFIYKDDTVTRNNKLNIMLNHIQINNSLQYLLDYISMKDARNHYLFDTTKKIFNNCSENCKHTDCQLTSFIDIIIATIKKIIRTFPDLEEIYVIFDGQPYLAKMNEQVKRRIFPSLMDHLFKDFKVFINGKTNLYKNHINLNPSTILGMMRKNLEGKLNKIDKLEIITNTIGEGEHIINDHITKKINNGNELDGKNILYFSPDADTILLNMVLYSKILNKGLHCNIDLLTFNVIDVNHYNFKTNTDIKMCLNITYIDNFMKHLFGDILTNYNKSSIIKSFIFIASVFGNDFIPKMESLSIGDIKSLAILVRDNYDFLKDKHNKPILNKKIYNTLIEDTNNNLKYINFYMFLPKIRDKFFTKITYDRNTNIRQVVKATENEKINEKIDNEKKKNNFNEKKKTIDKIISFYNLNNLVDNKEIILGYEYLKLLFLNSYYYVNNGNTNFEALLNDVYNAYQNDNTSKFKSIIEFKVLLDNNKVNSGNLDDLTNKYLEGMIYTKDLYLTNNVINKCWSYGYEHPPTFKNIYYYLTTLKEENKLINYSFECKYDNIDFDKTRPYTIDYFINEVKNYNYFDITKIFHCVNVRYANKCDYKINTTIYPLNINATNKNDVVMKNLIASHNLNSDKEKYISEKYDKEIIKPKSSPLTETAPQSTELIFNIPPSKKVNTDSNVPINPNKVEIPISSSKMNPVASVYVPKNPNKVEIPISSSKMNPVASVYVPRNKKYYDKYLKYKKKYLELKKELDA